MCRGVKGIQRILSAEFIEIYEYDEYIKYATQRRILSKFINVTLYRKYQSM